jgi:hypothetical protein
MPEIQKNSGESDKRLIWADLVDIEKSINEDVRKTYIKGFYSVPRDEIVKKLRERYKWKEKWILMDKTARNRWALTMMAYDAEHSDLSDNFFDIKKYEELAEKYFEEAGGVSKEDVEDALKKVEHDSIENVLRELGLLSGELENGGNIARIVDDFIIILTSLRKEVKLYNFSEEELKMLNSIDEKKLIRIKNETEVTNLLISYINILEKIISGNKKSV